MTDATSPETNTDATSPEINVKINDNSEEVQFHIESSVDAMALPVPRAEDYEVFWIDEPVECKKAIDLLLKESIVALDLEADNMFHYKNQLAVIQVGTADKVYLFDPIAIDDASLFQPLMGINGPLKIIHDAGFDIRLLYGYGITPGNIFDTALSAKFLGEPAMGLATLLDKYFSIKVNKEFQCIDWTQRPLNSDKLNYLVHDVIYLNNLFLFLESAVSIGDIKDELEVELSYMCLCSEDENSQQNLPFWTKIKGWENLTLSQLNVLKAIASIREDKAQKQDVPPSRIIKNSTMISIAKNKPDKMSNLKRIDRFNSGGRSILPELIAAIVDSADTSCLDDIDIELHKRAETPRQTRDDITRTKGLKKHLVIFRNKICEELSVDPQIVIPGHCLKDICTFKPQTLEALAKIRGFGEKRLSLYGREIIKIVSDV
jgi:ribonuclease D